MIFGCSTVLRISISFYSRELRGSPCELVFFIILAAYCILVFLQTARRTLPKLPSPMTSPNVYRLLMLLIFLKPVNSFRGVHDCFRKFCCEIGFDNYWSKELMNLRLSCDSNSMTSRYSLRTLRFFGASSVYCLYSFK